MITVFCVTCSNIKDYNEHLLCIDNDHLMEIYLCKCKNHSMGQIESHRIQKKSTYEKWKPPCEEININNFNKILEYNCDYCLKCIKNIEKSKDEAKSSMSV